MDIVIDIDGFFWPKGIHGWYPRAKREKISVVCERQPIIYLFEQYYLGFRSSMYICEDTVNNECEAKEVIQKLCKACIPSAMKCTRYHVANKLFLPAEFMWIARDAILSVRMNEYPEIKNIKLRLSMKPKTTAMAMDNNTIVFPALARSIATHCNLVLLNSILPLLDEKKPLTEEVDRREIARFVFPYLLFCHDNISVSNLPIIGAYSRDAITMAFQFTNLQMIFILAHEYAHILLKHCEIEEKEPECRLKKENEADLFALETVLAYIEGTEAYTKYDVLTALRWLFKYQLIEESMGRLIQGRSLDFSGAFSEERRGKCQLELFANHGLTGSTKLDALGFIIIVELQEILYEYGDRLINDILEAFNISKKTGGIRPWWESIPKTKSL